MAPQQDKPDVSRRAAPKSAFPPPGATIPPRGGYEKKPITPKELKRAEGKVLRVIVAMPILIVTSYYLYKRGEEKKKFPERIEPKKEGQLLDVAFGEINKD